MANITTLRLKNNILPSRTNLSVLGNRNATVNQEPSVQPNTDVNNGGFVGGVGYLGEKVGLGFLSGIEGLWDYTAGGIAKLFGNDEWAEKQFDNDWVNYNHADEWFNPGEGWKVAGDVAGGIGTSLPGMAGAAAGAAIIYASGGAGSSVGAKLILTSISSTIAGLSAAGNATKEAYRETGELTGKEFGYGALSGVTEAGLEFVSGGLSKGGGRIIDSMARSAAKETAETIAKTGAKSIFKQLGEDFVSEAFEEGLAEILSPVYQRMTYNPDAQNASLQEVTYAAVVGGLSGMVMSGSSIGLGAGVNSTVNFFSGKNSVESGTYAGVIEAGRALSEAEITHNTEIESFQSASETYNKLTESLMRNNNISSTEELLKRIKEGNITFKAKDKMLLGKLKRTSVVAHLHPYIERSARGLILDADNVAEKFSSFGMTDANGKPLSFTAEQILSGIDASLLEKAKLGTLTKAEAKTFTKSLRNALSTNSVLATLAVAEATGGIMMDTRRIAESILSGENLANAADLNYLIENGRSEELQALGAYLGIEDWSKATIDDVRTRIADLSASGTISEYAEQIKRTRTAIERATENSKPLPHVLRNNMQDGMYRYASEDGSVNMAVFKEGNTYHLYDYDSKSISRSLSIQDINKILRRYWNAGQSTTARSLNMSEEAVLARETENIDAYAAENIPEYHSLSEPNKAAVRMTIRQARAHGLSDTQTLVYAKVAARSGLNIIFDAKRAYGDGSLQGNTIYINPNNSQQRTFEVILGHEMFHKIFADGDKRVRKLFMDAKKLIDKEKAKEVKDRYKTFYNERGASPTTSNIISEEEVAAAGAEEVFRSADAWEYILGEEPSLSDKVLSFFRKSARDYSSIQGLSAQARKFVKEYKKLFDSIAEKNNGNNALSLALETEIHKKTPVTDTVQENTNVTGDNDEEAPTTTNTDVDTDTRFALSKGKAERLKNELVKLGTLSIRLDAGGKRIRILTDKFTQNKNIFSNKGRNMREVNARIKAIPHFAEILRSCTYDGTDTEIHGLENEAKKGVVAMHRFKGSYEGFDIEVVIRDKGAKQFLYEIKFIEKEKSPQQSMTDESVSPAPLGDAENKAIITHSEKKSNTPDENSSNNPPEERFALTDEAYLAAVEGGDIEAAKRIIRDAAHNAGYTVEAYHGTGADFNVFSEDTIGNRNVCGKGFYFGTSSGIADEYASQRAKNGGKYRIVSAFLKIDNPFIPTESTIGSAEEILDKWFSDMWKNYRELGIDYIQDKLDNSTLDLLQFIAEHNHTEIRDVLSEYGYDGVKDGGEIVVFSPEQIKSAETITYDDNGNIIPLSKRFDISNPDIRYGLTDDNSLNEHSGRGYDGYSMSNNARNAYEQGEMPLSRWTKTAILERINDISPEKAALLKKVPLDTLRKKLLYKSSWHHTSSMYRRTDFYSIDENLLESISETTVSEWINSKPAKETRQTTSFVGDIEYLEWGGTKKHPKAEKKKLKNVKINKVGSFYIVYDDNGEVILRKKVDSNGTYVTNYTEVEKQKQKEYEKKERERANSSEAAYAFYLKMGIHREYSSSGHVYPFGRKPSRADYEIGLEHFFKVGEQRLSTNERGGFDLETWNGKEWVSEAAKEDISPDNRYALPETDSKGAVLTDNQREYFANTKVLDKDGKLLRVYHGTRYADFTTFKRNVIYFTDSREMADSYAPNSELFEGYVNITNPYIVDAKGNKWSRIPVSNETKKLLESYGSSTFMEKGEWRTTPADIASAISDMIEEGDADYDGVIILNVDDTGSYYKTNENNVANDYIVFNSNQFKNVDNASPTLDSDIRFALSEDAEAIENYNEEEYNSFGWARYAGAISKSELDDLYSKILARTTLRTFKHSRRGEAIIEVNNKPHTTLNVNNVFVFVKGSKNNFRITRVLRFNAETETEMEIIKEALYEGRTCSDTYLEILEKEGTAREYRREDSATFTAYREGRSNGTQSRGADSNNRRSKKYRSGYSLTVGEDGEITERFALTGDEDLDAFLRTVQSEPDAQFNVEAILERGIPRKPGASTLTIGEMKKVIANNTHYKVFTKRTALNIISKLYKISDISQKTRLQLADALWQGLNDCTDIDARENFAHDMAEFIVAKILSEAKVENPNVAAAQERLSYLRTYIGSITFNTEQLSELRHIADKDGLKKLLGRWGFKGRNNKMRVPMDIFVCDIAREMPGMEEFDNMHPVEAFLKLNEMYEKASNDIKDRWSPAYLDMEDAEIRALVFTVQTEINRAFEEEGDASKFAKLVEGRIEYYSSVAEYWKAEHDNIKGRDRLLGLLVNQALKFKSLKLGTYSNATQAHIDIFNKSIASLSRINYRGNFNVTGTRKILGELYQWYTNKDVMEKVLNYGEQGSGFYVQDVADALEYLANGEKGFSKDDLEILYDIMKYFEHLMTNWNMVYRNGKLVEALPEAQRYVDIINKNKTLKVGLFAKLSGSPYAEMFNDPSSVMRRMDYYESGFFTEVFEMLREDAVDAEVTEMNVMEVYDEFLRKHKDYIEKATAELVEYRGHKIPKIQLIDLYMTMKRKHSRSGLALNGFVYTNAKGDKIKVNGIVMDENITEEMIEEAITMQSTEISKNLTEIDLEYIAIVEKIYNEDARRLKAERDIQRLGFTNATNDYYYPIRRAYTAQNVDTSDAKAEYDRVTNSSFNKDIVKGAKQKLLIESADNRLRRHVHAVCQYACLSPAIDTFNRLYNLDISGNANNPVSVRTESENTWKKGYKYFMKLISDIQGIPASSGEGMAILSAIRGSYAKFQLGANPKVWITQLSSLFASSSLLDASSITRGMTVSAAEIDKYCPFAKLRNSDNTAAYAQGVLDRNGAIRGKGARVIGKTGKISDILMAPIGKVDRFVVCRLFGACQVQIERNGGAKVGTEANKIEAGKLLKRVILETQQNSIATERSAAMRSGNEIYRTLTMFTADSMKVVGRVIDAIGELSVLKSRLNVETDANVKAEIKNRLKVARKKARKSINALVLTALFMAGIAQLFRWIYDKDKNEDETVVETMVVDAVGNLFGGLPLIKDLYARVFEGYDVDNYAYSSVNDLLDSTINLFTTAGNIINSEASGQDIAVGIKNLCYSIGQMTGIPTRNIYNMVYGLTKRFSPGTAYKIDGVFYKQNYQNDLYKAIEDDDAEMASIIMGLLHNERLGEKASEAVHNELYSLSVKGYKVIPRKVSSSVTINGEEYIFTEAEKEAIKDSYSASQDSLEKLFSSANYIKLSDEMKAEAINYVYRLHYDMAVEKTLGTGSNLTLVSSVVGQDKLSLLYATTKGLTSETDKDGNTISGSKRKKVLAAINALDVSREEKLLLLCAKGYALKDGDIRGLTADRAKKLLLNYILKLNVSKEEKVRLATMCGFEVTNGRIRLKSAS